MKHILMKDFQNLPFFRSLETDVQGFNIFKPRHLNPTSLHFDEMKLSYLLREFSRNKTALLVVKISTFFYRSDKSNLNNT